MEMIVGVALSIENVPEEKVELLKQRAERNRRSLQGELMAIIDAATAILPNRPMTVEEIGTYVRSFGVTTSDEAVRMIREDRDSR
jgi:antitoxin FitA